MAPQKKKTLPHTLPPIQPNGGLVVTPSNRQSLIPGSPAPMAMKEEASSNRRNTKRGSRDLPPSPTITLSRYWDDEDSKRDLNDSWNLSYKDSVVQINSAGGFHPTQTSNKRETQSLPSTSRLNKRPSTSWSTLSASSLAEVHKSVMERSSGGSVLNPPPRIISLQDGQGHNVITEFVRPASDSSEVVDEIPSRVQTGKSLTSKYSPLKPIQKKGKKI